MNRNTKVYHHLLQIIIWPNGDGTYRTILNSRKRLKELGIYDDYKMTIEMTASEHSKLHGQNTSDDTKRKHSQAYTGKKHSAETRKKISEANKGRTFSEDTRKKMSEAKKGMRLTEEHKRKLSEALKGRTFTEEHKKKLSEARKRFLY